MKTERKELSLSSIELETIQSRADQLGLSFSAFVVLCCCNCRITLEVGTFPTTQNLNTLASLYERGLLTKEEFEKVKIEILEGDSKGLISMKKRL